MEQQLLLSFHCTLVCSYITPVSNRMNIFGQHVNTRTDGMSCSIRVRGIEVEQYGFHYHSIALLVQDLFVLTGTNLIKYALYMHQQIQHV